MPTLFHYQDVGAAWLAEKKKAILADEMGLGKTAQAIQACALLDLHNILVICPKTLIPTWRQEFALWQPHWTVGVVHGSTVARHQQWSRWTRVAIVSYETFRSDFTEVAAIKWDGLIVDEAHRLRNRKARTTRDVTTLARTCPVTFLLTGTIVTNHPADVWPLLHIVDRGRFRSFWKFAEAHHVVYTTGFGWTVGPVINPDAYVETLQPYVLRRTKADVATELPSKIVIQEWLEPTEHQVAVQRQLLEDFYTQSNGHLTLVPTTIACMTRLRQAAIDPALISGGGEGLEGPKVSRLLEIIDEESRPVVVFSTFSSALHRLASTLQQRNRRVGVISAHTDINERSRLVGRLQRSKLDVLLCGIKSGGVGLTLTAATTAVFLDKHWSPAINVQAQDRLHRVGQTEPVTIVELLTCGSIDEYVESIVGTKRVHADVVNDEASAGYGRWLSGFLERVFARDDIVSQLIDKLDTVQGV